MVYHPVYNSSVVMNLLTFNTDASPEISNFAKPCPRLHTPLGRAEREVKSDANNTDRSAEGSQPLHSVIGHEISCQLILQLFLHFTISTTFLRRPADHTVDFSVPNNQINPSQPPPWHPHPKKQLGPTSLSPVLQVWRCSASPTSPKLPQSKLWISAAAAASSPANSSNPPPTSSES
jgi:hypothetical protein